MKHPTTNIQHRTSSEAAVRAVAFIGYGMFDVGCSMFSPA
jgi:hypothetical protein